MSVKFIQLLLAALLFISTRQNIMPVQECGSQNPDSLFVFGVPVTSAASVVYSNQKYGFDLVLPESWEGYTVIPDTWEGTNIKAGQIKNNYIVETGPKLTVRHPLWTAEEEYQDIPILIFTISQWESMTGRDGFQIGAAPIGPGELGRNSKFVFALPARYDFAYPTGHEEVRNIINGKAFRPTENIENEEVDHD